MPFLTTSQLRDRRLREAEEQIASIAKKYTLTMTKVIKRGPRYFVAMGRMRQRPIIFKICLYRDSQDHLTNEKFSREVLFLDFLQRSHYGILRRTAPGIYAFGIVPRAWYIREFLTGRLQNVGGGSVQFRPSFFTPGNSRWIIRFMTALHSIRPSDLPVHFRTLLHRPDFTHQLLVFMKPHWRRIEQSLQTPGASKQLQAYFRRNTKLYNNAPQVLVHQEPYADHFIKQPMRWRLIDWENVGWGNPVHDIIVIWMRASQYPAWQNNLRAGFSHHLSFGSVDKLWEMETIIQAVFNVISWHFHPYKTDFRPLYLFSKKLLTTHLKALARI